ncbi:hypothetical protein [Ruegeria atlantica]|uniref:hypothetical protein n=1 Tax=Ruegeria atlantica TaxID=81569 RepID=UPI00147AF6E8|nr:hypothetical protein [Ruegeria atlantica]
MTEEATHDPQRSAKGKPDFQRIVLETVTRDLHEENLPLQRALKTLSSPAPHSGGERPMTRDLCNARRRELSKVGVDRLAIDILPTLHGLSVSQAVAVIERARDLLLWVSVFDATSAEFSAEREALEALSASSDE